MKYLTYVGSYTDGAHPDGIHLFESDAVTGAFTPAGVMPLSNPIYMALNRSCTRLYTALARPSFGPAGRDGGVAAFAVDGDRLTLLNEMSTGWTVPCHVSLDPAEKALVYAEYSCGTAGYADLRADGSFDLACSGAPNAINPRAQVQHAGDGPNKPRQDRAHAHCSVVTPDGRYLMVVDLALDRIVAYDFRHRADGLREVPAMSIDTRGINPGAGPRHIVFHPNGRLAFVIYELGSLVSSFRYTENGFEHVETKSLLPKGTADFTKAAAIRVSEDGSQVFCSNRGHDSITVFDVDADTGRLEWLNNAKLCGQFPRDFAFMPGGAFMLVGLKESWRIASYAYEKATGAFTEVARTDGIYRPLFFAFKSR